MSDIFIIFLYRPQNTLLCFHLNQLYFKEIYIFTQFTISNARQIDQIDQWNKIEISEIEPYINLWLGNQRSNKIVKQNLLSKNTGMNKLLFFHLLLFTVLMQILCQ